MAFKITARTLFHLGSDLISSDAIALYELVKNSFDAGAKEVEIKCTVRIPGEVYLNLHRELRSDAKTIMRKLEMERALAQWKLRLDPVMDGTAPGAAEWRAEVQSAETLVDLLKTMEEANVLEVGDTGTGMTGADLEEVYLTIGTTHRLRQKTAQLAGDESPDRPILGDKGVGRLATMRLGTRLRVETTTSGEAHWNLLEIDWEAFRDNLEARLEDIDVSPALGSKKDDRKAHGTDIRIAGLTSEWSYERLDSIAREEVAKLTDPFSKRRFPVVLSFNERAIKIPRFSELLTEHAHAACSADFILDGLETRIEGTIDYRTAKRKTAFVARGAHLVSTGKAPSFEALERLGPFSVEFYWFNRQALKASMKNFENADELRQVLKLQEWWAGGLMVYRDGFRVNPYGSGDDDWLKLDQKALASSGYKVNRRQIVGRVSISARRNPLLVDQTNREGLQDSPELRSLTALLRYVVVTEFKGFLDRTDRLAKQQPSLTVSEVRQQVSRQRKKIGSLVKDLRAAFPAIEKETKLLSTLEEAIAKLDVLADEARRQIESYEDAQEKVIHLAATGLLVEILAHELNRATRHALRALEDGRDKDLPVKTGTLFRTLETQLKTLQKRISVLDPLSTSGRQVKQTFDLVEWVQEICATHVDQFKRHRIVFDLKVYPPRTSKCKVTMVKGMLVQILENLFDNSVYWLKQQSKVDRAFRPRLSVEIDTADCSISVTDNGPGIDPIRRDDVFQPFYTTKPAEGGKGLGLFIAREVAQYHKADLELSEVESDSGSLNTFILHLGKVMSQ